MPRGKKELAEQIIPKLREVEVEVGRGKTVLEAVKKIGVTGPPFPPERGARLQSAHVLRPMSIMSPRGECQFPRSRVLRRAPRADPESFVMPSRLEPFSVDPTEATPQRESLMVWNDEVVSVES